MFIVHALADYPPLSIDGGNDSIADNNIGDDNLKRHSHTWKNIGTFLRLAVNGDLATAWPFAVEGEAFAHRCLIQMFSLIFITFPLLVLRFRAWVEPVLDRLLQHIR